MDVLLITRDALSPDSPARALADLGCRLQIAGFDLHELDRIGAPQVLVLDARDHLESGYACLRALRARPELATTPSLLIVSTARLSSLTPGGADDFALFPIVPAELYARLRQLDFRFAAWSNEERLKIGDLVLDVGGHEAHLRDRRLALTHQEFELLKFLALHRGKVFTRAQLLAKVWGYRYYGGTRTVDIHVRRLRAKLGPGEGTLIETVRNVGYKMGAPTP